MGYTVFVLRYSHGKSAPSIFRLVANKSFFQFCIYAVLANMTAKKWETCHVTWYDQVLRNTFFHIFFFQCDPKQIDSARKVFTEFKTEGHYPTDFLTCNSRSKGMQSYHYQSSCNICPNLMWGF